MSSSPEKILKEYDRIAEKYDKGIEKGELENRSLKKIGREEKEGILEIAEPQKDDKALDMACGTGRIFIELKDICDSVYGVDISRKMLEICKEKINSDKDKLIQGNIFNLPFKKKNFSLITCLGATEYYSKEEILKMFNEVERVLKPDGRFAVTFQDRENSLIGEYIRSSEEELNCEIYVYSESEIEKIVERTEFKISKVERAGLQLQLLLEI